MRNCESEGGEDATQERPRSCSNLSQYVYAFRKVCARIKRDAQGYFVLRWNCCDHLRCRIFCFIATFSSGSRFAPSNSNCPLHAWFGPPYTARMKPVRRLTLYIVYEDVACGSLTQTSQRASKCTEEPDITGDVRHDVRQATQIRQKGVYR